jgi:glycosyltransferase involved in cell wall biosynthesis
LKGNEQAAGSRQPFITLRLTHSQPLGRCFSGASPNESGGIKIPATGSSERNNSEAVASSIAGRPETKWPRITLVTPVYNGARYIEDTIRSIVYQGYPSLEYMIVDGGSTDGTIEIIRKYEKHLSWWGSQPDRGLYDALNTGFGRATGEVMGWLNASDMLHTKGLFVVGSVFAALQEVEWITGRPTRFDAQGKAVDIRALPHWSRYRFLAGANRYIQQESTYWRKSLWERAGSRVDASLRAEGDFELWVRFFRHARLYSVDALIGGYRSHGDALSSENLERYDRTCDDIVERELASVPGTHSIRLFRRFSAMMKKIPKVRGLWQRAVINSLYRLPGPDWPPKIVDDGKEWVIRP